MTIAQLIAHLQELVQHGVNPQAVVRIYCPDREDMVPAEVMIYGDGFCDLLPGEGDENYDDDE